MVRAAVCLTFSRRACTNELVPKRQVVSEPARHPLRWQGCCYRALAVAAMPPALNTKETIAKELDAETWLNVCGEEAEKDFLFVVEVYAKWCGPSEAIIMTLKRIQMELSKRKVKFAQIEATEEIPELAKYTTLSRPHFLFFRNGEHMDTVEGVNAPQIEKFIGDFIPEGVLEIDEAADGDGDDDD